MGKSDFDKDSFWDLDLLIPKRKHTTSMKPFASEIRTAEVADDKMQTAVPKEELRLTVPPADAQTTTQE